MDKRHTTTVSDLNFQSETIYAVNKTYVNCVFHECTIIIRNGANFGLHDCHFYNCNWHVDFLFNQFNKGAVNGLKALVNLIADTRFAYGSFPRERN
jgi:hypothetical protein